MINLFTSLIEVLKEIEPNKKEDFEDKKEEIREMNINFTKIENLLKELKVLLKSEITSKNEISEKLILLHVQLSNIITDIDDVDEMVLELIKTLS